MTKDNNTIYVLDNLRGCMDTITGIPEKTAQDINLIKNFFTIWDTEPEATHIP